MGVSYLFLYMILLVTLICLFFIASSFFCFSYFSTELVSSYECGFEPLSINHIPFCMKFFLLALIFLVFDVEVALVFPSIFSSTHITSFILILLLGLLFEYSYGGLS